eukprot:5742989-Pleurochrysis_carterae.AAC.2
MWKGGDGLARFLQENIRRQMQRDSAGCGGSCHEVMHTVTFSLSSASNCVEFATVKMSSVEALPRTKTSTR